MYSVQAIYCIEYMFGILNHFVKSISFVDSFVDEFFTMFVCSWISCSVAKHHDGTDRKWVSLLCTATGTPHAEQFLSTAHRDLTGTTHNISEIGFTFSFCVSLCFFVGLLVCLLLFCWSGSFWFVLFHSGTMSAFAECYRRQSYFKQNLIIKLCWTCMWNWKKSGPCKHVKEYKNTHSAEVCVLAFTPQSMM